MKFSPNSPRFGQRATAAGPAGVPAPHRGKAEAKRLAMPNRAEEALPFVLEGSANLRTNRNREQLTIFNDPELHAWHSAWIDELGAHDEPK